MRESCEEVPAVRHAERLAAAEGHVRNAGAAMPRRSRAPRRGRARRTTRCRGPTPRSRRCSARCSGWSAATRRTGAPGTRRPSALHRTRPDQVKRMYGCAITCSETSSSFGVSHSAFLAGAVGLVSRCSAVFDSLVTFASCCLLVRQALTNGIRCQRFASGVPRPVVDRTRRRARSRSSSCHAAQYARHASASESRRRSRAHLREAPRPPSPSRSAAPAASRAARRGSRRSPSRCRRDCSKVPSGLQPRGAVERSRNAVLARRRLERAPLPRRRADAHQRAGVEAEGAERTARASSTAGTSLDVDARRRERHLERQPGRSRTARQASCTFASEPPGTLAPVRRPRCRRRG